LSTHDPYAAFRRPDFRRLLCAWCLSGFANKMQTLAIGWYVYERTGSALSIGWVGLAQFGPALLLFLPAGQLVDRYERRTLLTAALGVSACAALLMMLTALNQWSLGLLYLGCAINSAALTLNRPARASMVPTLVPSDVLPNAVAWAAGSFQAATFSGPVMAGMIIALSGDAIVAFGLNCVLYVCALLMALRIGTRERRTEMQRPGLNLHDILAGVHHVLKSRIILGSLLLDLASALFGGATALLPVYAKDILQVGPAGLGWLTAAPAVGALLTAITLGHLRPTQRGGMRFLLAMAGYGIATMIFGLSTSFMLSMAALFVFGSLNNINQITRQTLMQAHTPDELRGRASSVNAIVAVSSNELGAFECAAVAALTTPVVAVVSGGAITLLAAGLVAWKFPELRRLKSLSPETADGVMSNEKA